MLYWHYVSKRVKRVHLGDAKRELKVNEKLDMIHTATAFNKQRVIFMNG